MGFQGPGPALDREKMPPLCDTERCLKLYSWHESWKVYKALKKCYGPTRNYLFAFFRFNEDFPLNWVPNF